MYLIAQDYITWAREKLGDGAKIELKDAFEIMRVDPRWFVDERTLELVETYLFHRPLPSQAYPGRVSEQPAIWIEAKIILDSQIGII